MRESKIETLSNNTSINDLRSNSNECKKKEIEMEKTRDTGDRNLHRPCTIILMYTTVTWTRDERTRWMRLSFFCFSPPSLDIYVDIFGKRSRCGGGKKREARRGERRREQKERGEGRGS